MTASGASPQAAAGKPSLTAPLGVRNYRLLWFGETVSVLGDQFYLVALPWLALQLTGSGLALGSVLMTAAIPRAVFMLAGGAATDRFSPRATMLASNVFRCLLTATMAALVLLHVIRLWHLYVLSAVFGVFDAFFYPAYVSMLPSVLETEQLPAGNSLMQSSAQLTSLVGPAPAGVLIAVAGVGMAFAVDAGSFVASIVMLALIRPKPLPQAASHGSLFGSIREGVSYALGHPLLRAMLISMAAINLCVVGPFAVGAPLLAKLRFGSATALGTMFSVFGGGCVAGALAAGKVRAPRVGALLLSVALAAGLGMSALGFAQRLWFAAAVLGGIGLVAGFANVHFISVLQRSTEPGRLGRVMSVLMFGSHGLFPLSYLAAGAMAELGTTPVFVASGISVLLTCGLVARRRSLWSTAA